MLDEQTTDCSLKPAKINIYVGNLTMTVTEAMLLETFTPYGQVVAIKILNDDYIGNRHPRFYAFVGMAEKTEGETAIAHLDGATLGGQVLSVISALPLSRAGKPLAPGRGRYGQRRQSARLSG